MKIPDDVPSPVFEKLRLLKQEDGFGDKPWTPWFRYLVRNVSLEQSTSELLTGATRENLAKLWMQNYAQNMPIILGSQKLSNIPQPIKPLLVVGAGPSIKKKDHVKILHDWIDNDLHRRNDLVIIATDRMLIPLIKAEVYPDYAITVDGNREKIIKWYDDPIVTKDAVKGVILGNTVAPNVANLLVQKQIPIYWFIAMLDDFKLATNVTRLMFWMTDATVVGCGGNAGTAAWAVGNYLHTPEIALIGLDFGYAEGTPIEETAYYHVLQQMLQSNPNALNGFYFDDYNPDFGEKCYSDVMMKHYKNGFLEMMSLSKIPTFNCTEGGILYGTGIKGMKFADWLNKLDTANSRVAPKEITVPA